MMAKIQQLTMIFLALDIVQMDLDLMGWQMAMQRSTVNAVSDRAEASMPKYWNEGKNAMNASAPA